MVAFKSAKAAAKAIAAFNEDEESVKSEPSTLPPRGPNVFYYASEDPEWDEEDESIADSAFCPVKQEIRSESESGKSSES